MESQNRTRSARAERDLSRSARVNGGIVLLGLVGMFVVSQPAFAVAAVIRIDQASAKAGDVTPGDGPGFPVSITRPGSYRLTSNLKSLSGPAIVIAADNVSLDLNGFAIIGSNVFPSEAAIVGDDRKYIRISNGSVAGFSFGLQFLGTAQFVTVEKLVIGTMTRHPAGFDVQGVAILLGRDTSAHSIIREVAADGQIQITCPSLVIDTIAALSGVVEMNVPYNGGGRDFPANCAGTNVR